MREVLEFARRLKQVAFSRTNNRPSNSSIPLVSFAQYLRVNQSFKINCVKNEVKVLPKQFKYWIEGVYEDKLTTRN